MPRISLLIFFSFLFSISFSQRRTHSLLTQDSLRKSRSLIEFYNKIWYTDLFTSFTSKYSPSIGIGSTTFTTNQDSSSLTKSSPYKDELHTLEFVGHPLFNDSIKGRLERFTSVCWDGSCVREVSSKLYFHFETDAEVRKFICALLDSLRQLSDTLWNTKTEEIEKYEFASDLRPDRYEPEFMRYWQYVVITLSRKKVGKGFQILIADY